MPKTIERSAQRVRSGAAGAVIAPRGRGSSKVQVGRAAPARNGTAAARNGAAANRLANAPAPGRRSAAAEPPTTADLWKRLRRASDEKPSPASEARRTELRNQLIERFYDIVRFTAERMRLRLPAEVELDDLMSAGLFGLMDAIDAFDPSRGVKFETYCTQRVHGAIVDELRSMDWVPRLVRSRTAKVERARKQIEMSIGRKPTDAELAEKLGANGEEFTKLTRDSRPVGVVSLNRKFFETDSNRDVREIDVIRDLRQQNPMELLQRDDLRVLLTKGFSRAERLILILYYEEEMTMKEIGATLNLSESRVSQMHSSILARLRAQIAHRLKEI
ncbi:MAG: FliA/WhiG family RNA polymerase sigma factor [Phycisphaerae bacterium]|nr:FliA/WhiG family RNA polymerase sigma factor [Phycisphaerae bacterium]